MSDRFTELFSKAASGQSVSVQEISSVLGTEDPGAQERLAATANLLRRNHLSAVRRTADGTIWAEALFCLEYGYERRMADPQMWDEWEEMLYESAQDALLAEHERAMAEQYGC